MSILNCKARDLASFNFPHQLRFVAVGESSINLQFVFGLQPRSKQKQTYFKQDFHVFFFVLFFVVVFFYTKV